MHDLQTRWVQVQLGHVQMQLVIWKQLLRKTPLASVDGHVPLYQQKEWHGRGHPVQVLCQPEALWQVLCLLIVDVAAGGCQGELTDPT